MQPLYDIEAYDYALPEANIAQTPASRREHSKLLWVNYRSGKLEEARFDTLASAMQGGDLLVVNNTKVFPARLYGHKETGGKIEFLMMHYPLQSEMQNRSQHDYQEALVQGLLKSSKRPKVGARLVFCQGVTGEVDKIHADGTVRIRLRCPDDLEGRLDKAGNMPLPPYIKREKEQHTDRQRYQTVYAQELGAVAAPTAGLHFSEAMLSALKEKGVETASVTLHVGYGTFSPVRVSDIREHRIHGEYVNVSAETASAINRALKEQRNIWVVGTTTARALEWAAMPDGMAKARQGICELYIYPGYEFKIVKRLITNFHLPKSSLLFMVCALAGHERVMHAYQTALEKDFRFYSYGDAMALVP